MQNIPPVNMELWKKLTDRLAEEMARGYSLNRIAIESGLNTHRGHSSVTLAPDRIKAWTLNPEAMRENRYIDQIAPADEIEQKLSAWFAALDKERAENQTADVPFVETAVSRKVWGGFEQARELCKPVEISAPPGTGKTCSVDPYIAKCRKLEGFGCPVWRIDMGEFSISLKNVLQKIGEEINAKNASYSIKQDSDIVRMIEEQTEGRKGLLIVDEAQHIGDANSLHGIRILNGLRYFTDKKLFGIAFLSNGEIYRRVVNAKNTQLSSRMEAWRVEIKNIPDDDIDLIIGAWGVSGKDAREWCINKAKGAGGLRVLTDLFVLVSHKFGVINYQTLTMIGRL
jgi:DNA transposition AAA+ family ATPase